MESIKLECSNGWVKIERLVEDDKDAIKLTTNFVDGEVKLTLLCTNLEKANEAFSRLSAQNPYILRAAILNKTGF